MRFPIEFLAVFILVCVVLVCLVLKFLTGKILEWRYKPDANKSRPSPNRSGTPTAVRGEPKAISNSSGSRKSEEQSPIQTATPKSVREDSYSFRANLTK